MNHIYNSKQESKILGLNIARGELDIFNEQYLLSQLIAGKYDVGKIKINAADPDFFRKINRLNIPYSISSIIYRNSKPIGKLNNNYKKREEIEFEEYDGSQQEVLSSVIRSVLSKETGVYFNDSYLDGLVTKEKAIDASVAYGCTFNRLADKNKIGWLIKYKGKYIGYNLGQFDGSDYEGVLIGVFPRYRNLGVAREVYARYTNEIFPQLGVQNFYNDIQIQNIPSLKSTFYDGILPEKAFFNVTLTCFFSNLFQPIISTKANIDWNQPVFSNEDVQRQLNAIIPPDFCIVQLKQNRVSSQLLPGNYEIQVCKVIATASLMLLVYKAYQQNQLVAYGYLELS